MNQGITWDEHKQNQAYADGWGVFDRDGNPQIMKLDDPASVGLDFECKFDFDDDAVRHVIHEASAGNPLARQAIAFCDRDMEHDGFVGSVRVAFDDGCLYGAIKGIERSISYTGPTFADLREAFVEAVNQFRARNSPRP